MITGGHDHAVGATIATVALRKRRSWCAGDRFRPTRRLALAELEQAADPPPARKQGRRGHPARRLTIDAVEVRTFGDEQGARDLGRQTRFAVVALLDVPFARRAAISGSSAPGVRIVARHESGLNRWVLWRCVCVLPGRGGGVGIRLIAITGERGPNGVSRSEEGALVRRALSHHVHHVDPSARALRDRAPTSRGVHRRCWARQPGLARRSAGAAAAPHREHRHRRRDRPDRQTPERRRGNRLRDGAARRVHVHPRRHPLHARHHHVAKPSCRSG